MDTADVVYSGVLKKSPPERRLMRTWHKRYFVLKSNKTLTYYSSEKDKKAVKEPIDLNFCQSIEANLHHNNKNYKHVFCINTTKRVYYLVADSKVEMDNWVRHLCKVCGFEKQGSPDFGRNRTTKSSPKAIKPPQQKQTTTLPSPMTPSPPPLCPLSQSMPLLNPNKARSMSDPPDHEAMMKRAEQQYLASTLDRRKSTEVNPYFERPTMTLLVNSPDLSQVPEHSESFPSLQSTRQYEVDGGSTPVDHPSSTLPTENYDIVPGRPVSQDIYDKVPPPRPASQCPDDIYDTPPMRGTEQGANYDLVPPPRPLSQNGQVYDHVPPHNRYSYNPEDLYDMVPNRASIGEYDTQPTRELYDMVPPPRPQKNNSDYYDTLPPPVSSPTDDLYDFPPNFHNENTPQMQPPSRPPKSCAVTSAKDHYDIVPAPSGRASRPETENRDSGSYPDDVYSIPIARALAENDIYDIPPKPCADDVYDELPRQQSEEDYYDLPPFSSQNDCAAPPIVDRSIKPPPINRSIKPPDHNYTNLAPPVDRKCKPLQSTRIKNHGYENLQAPGRGALSKSQSLPETETHALLRNCQKTDYCDMQPYRSEDTRCYSFTRDIKEPCYNYEDMNAHGGVLKRESGVHSNSSSSEDGDTEDCYMTMGPPDKTAHQQRKAALQYCEVQIIDGQAKCQTPAPRRDAESHYTTINEESTQAFLQTCRQQETSRN